MSCQDHLFSWIAYRQWRYIDVLRSDHYPGPNSIYCSQSQSVKHHQQVFIKCPPSTLLLLLHPLQLWGQIICIHIWSGYGDTINTSSCPAATQRCSLLREQHHLGIDMITHSVICTVIKNKITWLASSGLRHSPTALCLSGWWYHVAPQSKACAQRHVQNSKVSYSGMAPRQHRTTWMTSSQWSDTPISTSVLKAIMSPGRCVKKGS